MSQAQDQVQKDLVTKVATVLSLLGDEPNSLGVPESSLYIAACNTNLDDWNMLKAVLLKADLVSIKFHAVTLTPKGKAMADKLNAALKQSREQAA